MEKPDSEGNEAKKGLKRNKTFEESTEQNTWFKRQFKLVFPRPLCKTVLSCRLNVNKTKTKYIKF